MTEMMQMLQFILGAVFLAFGVIVFFGMMTGVFRFGYVLNRMHAAAMGDTLGISLSLIGLMIWSGFCDATLKMFLVIVFLWCASPVSSHLIARLEVTTNEKLDQDVGYLPGSEPVSVIREEVIEETEEESKKWVKQEESIGASDKAGSGEEGGEK